MTQNTGDNTGARAVAGQDTPNTVAATTGRTQEAARREGERIAGDVRSIADDAQQAARDTADATKERAADEFSATAKALRTAAAELEEHSVQRQMFERAAEGLKEVADAIHGRSITQMTEELSRLGRRNPTLFLGTAALAGFAFARFGRASTPPPSYDERRPPYGVATESVTKPAVQPTPAPVPGSAAATSEGSMSDV